MSAGLKNVYIFSNEQISPGITGIPVGCIAPYLKSYPNTPALPNWFVECNGQVLNDPLSPYNGATLPNLNGSGGGTQYFLRGNTTSGATGGAETHTHTAVVGNVYTPAVANALNQANHLPPYYEVVWIMRIR